MVYNEISEEELLNSRAYWELFSEIEAGEWYVDGDRSHRSWLETKCAHRFGAGAQFYVAYEHAVWVGMFSVVSHSHPKHRGWTEILDLGVVREHRGKGYAQEMLGEAERLARGADHCSLHVETFVEDYPALATYERYGFQKLVERPGVNGASARGQVLFWKMLG